MKVLVQVFLVTLRIQEQQLNQTGCRLNIHLISQRIFGEGTDNLCLDITSFYLEPKGKLQAELLSQDSNADILL